jgi:transposase
MAKTFREWVPEQNQLLPPSVQDWVPAGHLVHFVLSLVREQLDLGGILEKYSEERGYPPFHPAMMVGLLLYAYSRGIYSSRRIAKACEERVDFMALTGMQEPDFRTVNLFRLRHLQELKGLYGQVLKLCRKAGLARLGHVALDGTKMRANASKDQSMRYSQMKKKEIDLQAEIDRWFQQAAQIDEAEDEQYGSQQRGDELPGWVCDKQKRLEKIQQAKAELEAEAQAAAQAPTDPTRTKHESKPTGVVKDKTQKNFTDRDSRIMKTSGGYIQGYNCQAAVDAASQVIVAQQVAPNGSDMHQLTSLVKQIRVSLKRQAREVSADAGYCSEHNLKELQRRHIRGYVASRWQKDTAKQQRLRPPAGVGLYLRQMWQRLRRGSHRSRYRLRKQVVEPVFGQIKHARGFRQFLLRGANKVSGEWSLLCTAHNLLKLAAVSG